MQPGDSFFPNDDFSIKINVVQVDGERLIEFEFNQHTLWFRLTPQDALRFTNLILEKINEAYKLRST